MRVKLNKGCLKQSNNLTYDYRSRVSIYIVYELGASSSKDSDPTLKNCSFGAVTLTKNADIEKYEYSGYGRKFFISRWRIQLVPHRTYINCINNVFY